MVPVLGSTSARSWPLHERGAFARYMRASEALTARHATDAHFAAYSLPDQPRRLATVAVDRVPEGVPMVLAVFDVDCGAAHAAGGGAQGEADVAWWEGELRKIGVLLAAHPGGFVYRTRGGYRLVYALADPVVLRSPDDGTRWKSKYVAWCRYLAARFGIVADAACKDWTRLYRLPRVLRDAAASPENRPTLGDPRALGSWVCPIVAAMPDEPEPRPPRPPVVAGGEPRPTWNGDPGALFRALQARGMVGKALGPGKWAVACPWSSAHTKGTPYDSSTVLFAPGPGQDLGWWHCSHAHCQGRTLGDVLGTLDPGELAAATPSPGACPEPVTDLVLDLAQASTPEKLEAVLGAILHGSRPGVLDVVAVTCGGGKTTGGVVAAANLAARSAAPVIFATPTHDLAEEALAHLERKRPGLLDPHLRVAHIRGAADQCLHVHALVELGRLEAADALRGAFHPRTGGRSRGPCGLAYPASDARRCGSAATCPGAVGGEAQDGALTFVAHAALPHVLRRGASEVHGAAGGEGTRRWATVIIDEIPDLMSADAVDGSEIAALADSGSLLARWAASNPCAAAFAAVVGESVARLAAEYSVNVNHGQAKHAGRLHGGGLVTGLRGATADLEPAAARFLAEMEAHGPRATLPKAPPDELRSARGGRWPNVLAHEVLVAVAEAAVGSGADLTWELCLGRDGAVSWERWAAREIRTDAAFVALDGTAELTWARWAAIAGSWGLELRRHRVRIRGASPSRAHHYRTHALDNARLWVRRGARVEFLPQAPGAVRNALFGVTLAVARTVGLTAPGVLGIGCMKPLADALRVGLGFAVDRPAFDLDDPFAVEVGRVAADMDKEGWELRIGHAGRHDRGTQVFFPADGTPVDGMAVLGPLRFNLGTIQAEARAILRVAGPVDGLDADRLADVLAAGDGAARSVQFLARPRHVRRFRNPPFLVFAGPACPISDLALPGVTWSLSEASHAPAPTAITVRAGAAIVEAADRLGALSARWVAVELPPRTLDAAVETEARRRGWDRHVVRHGGPGRPWTVWAACRDAAERAARVFAGDPSSQCSSARSDHLRKPVGQADPPADACRVSRATGP
jgi:hypothetical protein